MISSEASSSWLIRHMKCFPADFSPVSVSSPVVQRHEGCVWQLDSTRSTGHPGSSPAAAQDQAQLLNWKCAGDPQHVSRSVLQTILLGGKRHPPHVHQAGTSSCSTCRLLQTLEEEEQIHPELHRAAPRPHAVPEGGERQPSHNQTPRGHFRLKVRSWFVFLPRRKVALRQRWEHRVDVQVLWVGQLEVKLGSHDS